jgi:hypothetical protein
MRQATLGAAESPGSSGFDGLVEGVFRWSGVAVAQHWRSLMGVVCLTKVNQINKLDLCCGATSCLSRCRAPRNRSLSAWFAAVATVKEVA